MNPPKDTQYLFLDMNSFFASCEQQENIYYRNKPLVVTPVNCPTGCVVSASYEAKAYGIKTGTIIKDAKFIYPQVVIRSSDTFLYLSYHERLVKILKSFSPWLEVMSIDEAVIKLSPTEQNSKTAQDLAKIIKQTIQTKLGRYMRSSVGIGPNIFLAKQAAEFQKPDGLTEIKLSDLKNYYSKTKLTDLKGIGFRMNQQLNTLGIYQPLDLYFASCQNLRTKLGIMGEYWHLKLHGYDVNYSNPISAYQNKSIPIHNLPKSIGHSHVLEPRFRTWKLAWAVCLKLIQKAGCRLRADKLQAQGVHMGVRFLGEGGWHKSMKVQVFSDNLTLTKLVLNLWNKIPKNDYLPLKVGVSVFNLSLRSSKQQRIFAKWDKWENASMAIDKINDQYGSFCIKPANLLSVDSSAPDRIAFGRPVL